MGNNPTKVLWYSSLRCSQTGLSRVAEDASLIGEIGDSRDNNDLSCPQQTLSWGSQNIELCPLRAVSKISTTILAGKRVIILSLFTHASWNVIHLIAHHTVK